MKTVAPLPCEQPPAKKEDSEVSEARTLLESEDVILANKTVTLDALHNKAPTLRGITEKGGDYLVGTKNNTSDRTKACQKALREQPPF